MKKIVLTLVALMSLTFASAEEVKSAKTENVNEVNYDMTVNYGSLANALGLDYYQLESVERIHERYINDMNKVAKAPEADKAELVKKVTEKELKRMSYVLDREQYRKFNMLINTTLVNRGLLK
jgi:hypothetical protein